MLPKKQRCLAADDQKPIVCIAILAKDKEKCLPLYLKCIENLDYPKSRLILYVRTNDNSDRTEGILWDWLSRISNDYHSVSFVRNSIDEKLKNYTNHQWDERRFKALAAIRFESLKFAIDARADFYFVADCDNFLTPASLANLVELNLDIVAPLLTLADRTGPNPNYANFHAAIDENGYFRDDDAYYMCLNQTIQGLILVPVVHCTYLVRCSVASALYFDDGTGRHEYVIFSESARLAGVNQYLDNRMVYGYIYFDEMDENYFIPGLSLRTIEEKIFSSRGGATGADGWVEKIIVASHERSGTHFLMNKISSYTLHTSVPWTDIDVSYLGRVTAENKRSESKTSYSIYKTHFIPEMLSECKHGAKIFYIYRNPFDVMFSFWKYSHRFEDHAKPMPDLLEFIFSAPSGKCIEYSIEKYDNYLERWLDHVARWFSEAHENANVVCLSYDKLLSQGDTYLFAALRALDVDFFTTPEVKSEFFIPGKDIPVDHGAVTSVRFQVEKHIHERNMIKISDDGLVEMVARSKVETLE